MLKIVKNTLVVSGGILDDDRNLIEYILLDH